MKKFSIAAGIAAILLSCLRPAGAMGAAPSTVSYQGRLDVNGQPFTGQAGFKFAILCGTLPGTVSVWSNDGSSVAGSQPTGAVTLAVEGGIFSVRLGDEGLGMVALSSYNVDQPCNQNAQLRVWVDTGSGFEQLADQPLSSSPYALLANQARFSTDHFYTLQSDLVAYDGRIRGVDMNGYVDRVWLDGKTGLAHCDTLEFGDGTRMTTAAAGGGNDGDWNVSGSNMSAAVAGNVGVGTTAPDRKLHVSGGADIDSAFNGGYVRIGPATTGNLLLDNNEIQAVNNGAANNLGINVEGGSVGIGTVNPSSRLHVLGSVRADGAGGFDVRNPNNTAAISRFDWNADIARIRVGGTGTGSLNGFDIQGISDASWLRILNNGNVGLGTTTPSQRLEVAGNAVITGNLTVQGTISGGGAGGAGIIAIPSSAFLEEETNQMDVHRSNVLLHGRTAGQGLTFEAPVYLPNGATITGFEVHLTDSDGTRNIQTFLLSHPYTAGAGAIIATLASTGTPGRTSYANNSLGAVVNNAANHYVVACNWTTPNTVTSLAIHGMKITYTLP